MIRQLFSSHSHSRSLPELCLIGRETTIRGEEVTGRGDLRIEGTVHADVQCEGRVVVALGGEIHGEVRARSVHVAGHVRGALQADDTLVLAETADVDAHLQAGSLTIEPGANVHGVLRCEGEAGRSGRVQQDPTRESHVEKRGRGVADGLPEEDVQVSLPQDAA